MSVTLKKRSPRSLFSFRGIRAIVLFTFLAVFVGCVTAPYTGRKQLISPTITVQHEIDLGTEAYKQALSASNISGNTTYNRRVERIGHRLAEASGRSDLPWEFKVIEDDNVVNAWALPGGKIAVYTGLLRLTEGDDALLATVMGHEIAHVIQRHGAERLTQELGMNIIASGLLIALQNEDPEDKNLILQAFAVGADVFAIKPFSRDMETESDRVGLIFMAKAGYNPEKSIEFWQRMGEATGADKRGSSIADFLSTHPSHGKRLADLRKYIPEAQKYYKPITP